MSLELLTSKLAHAGLFSIAAKPNWTNEYWPIKVRQTHRFKCQFPVCRHMITACPDVLHPSFMVPAPNFEDLHHAVEHALFDP